MHDCQSVAADAEIQAAAVIAGFVGVCFVAVEAETAKVGLMWKEVAAAAAVSVAIVAVTVALTGFVVAFDSLVIAVVPSATGFVATTALEIVATVSVAAASVRD